MASDEPRSSSRASRTFQDLLTSEQRSFFGRKKSQLKSVSDKLIWFSPVHSPLLSPAREKPTVKKKVRQSSIFSIQSRGKGPIVAEEPTSPKVSCIGQVRGLKKDKDPFADAFRKKCSQSKLGSMSPARFFSSPGRPSKWGSLFGSRKDPRASSPAYAGNGEGDLSYFHVSMDPSSAIETDKRCDFLARCPNLSREERGSDKCLNNLAMPLRTDASDSQYEERGNCAASSLSIDAIFSGKADLHASMPALLDQFSQNKGGNEDPGSARVVQSKSTEIHCCEGFENSSQVDCHERTNAFLKQKLNYEDLPSLHCGAFVKQNMKISVEVVPETWLWRHGEKLRMDSLSYLNCVQDHSASISRGVLQNAQHEELNMPPSPCDSSQANTKDGEQCVDYQILPVQSHATDFEAAKNNNETNDCLVEASNCLDDTSCKSTNAGKPTMNGSESTSNTELSGSQVIGLPGCMHVGAFDEKSEEFHGEAYAACSETSPFHTEKQQLYLRKSRIENVVDRKRDGKESSEIKPSSQTMRRIGGDLGKENYSNACPPLLERNLPSLQCHEDGKQFWSMFNNKKAEACSEHPFSTLILVGYDQLAASKPVVGKDAELFRGILEIGKLSFHGSGKYFHVLTSDVAFNRSRSATSVRTAIRLQRCNSDPCRPSY